MRYSLQYILERRYDPSRSAERKMSERFVILNASLKILSPYPAYTFLNMGITADAVTYTSIFFIICSAGFFLTGLPTAGILMLLLFLLLDSVDGDMARVSGPSKYGGTLDSLGADFFYGLIPLSLGYFLLQNQITLWVFTSAFLFLCAALVSIVFIIARIINIKTLRVLVGNNATLEEVKDTAFADKKSTRARFLSRMSAMYRHVLIRGNFFSEPGMTFWFSFFVLAGLYKALGAYLIVSLGYGAGLLVINLTKIYFVFRSLSRQMSKSNSALV